MFQMEFNWWEATHFHGPKDPKTRVTLPTNGPNEWISTHQLTMQDAWCVERKHFSIVFTSIYLLGSQNTGETINNNWRNMSCQRVELWTPSHWTFFTITNHYNILELKNLLKKNDSAHKPIKKNNKWSLSTLYQILTKVIINKEILKFWW